MVVAWDGRIEAPLLRLGAVGSECDEEADRARGRAGLANTLLFGVLLSRGDLRGVWLEETTSAC